MFLTSDLAENGNNASEEILDEIPGESSIVVNGDVVASTATSVLADEYEDWALESLDNGGEKLSAQIDKLVSEKDLDKTTDERLDMLHQHFNKSGENVTISQNMMLNGVYVVQGEASAIVALLKKFNRHTSHLPALDEYDPLLRNFVDLREVLNSVTDLSEMNSNTFLSPFLEIIKSEGTDGLVTTRALAAVDKFINCSLLNSNSIRMASAVFSVAEAVTKTKFVGTSDTASDECVLYQILQTLRSLLLFPGGRHLTDKMICEVLQCCFRIALEPSLSELLRMSAELVLSDMTRILFTRVSCVRELLRFLIALTNPLDRTNTNSMILMGLNLLTIALEMGADYFANYPLLMPLVKNEMCRALLQLLDNEKIQIFTAVNRVCFLLFEALRTHLKFQLESYFIKLKGIITNEQTKTPYELKEIALESLVMMWRIPGLITELYLNYDCSMYCSNLFEDLTRLLLQNAFPLGGLRSTHILSLDALLAVVETIERNCVMRQADMLNSLTLEDYHLQSEIQQQFGQQTQHCDSETVQALDTLKEVDNDINEIPPTVQQHNMPAANIFSINANQQIRPNRQPVSLEMPSISEIIDRKKRKKLIAEATELFNLKPNKGVEFLTEKGILKSADGGVTPADIAIWLRKNPGLDKTKIAEYICNRNNSEILKAFVESFPFEGLRLDEALRKFLETFRLPGESPEISKLMTHFSEHWYASNNQPFGDVDAAFTLSYAVIMLNTDQHNMQARRLQPPMNFESFKKNLSGMNAGQNFEDEMLHKIYNAIKNEEIVMPAEQTGLVRENYLWKILLRRSESPEEGRFLHAPVGWNDHDLFSIIWGSATAALSYVFDKSNEDAILTKSLSGYRKCAAIAAYYGMTNVFDNLIIHLCKFSTLMSSADDGCGGLPDASDEPAISHSAVGGHGAGKAHSAHSLEALAVSFAEDRKAQMATKTMFHLVHKHGDNLREGWKNVLDCLLHLFRAHLLPAKLVEVEDFVDPKGFVSIQRVHKKKATQNRQETSIFSWLGFTGSDSPSGRRPSIEQEQLIKQSKAIIADCHPEQLVTDSKYLTSSALAELMSSIMHASQTIAASQSLSSSMSASGHAGSAASMSSSPSGGQLNTAASGYQSDDGASLTSLSTTMQADGSLTGAHSGVVSAQHQPYLSQHRHQYHHHQHRLRLSAQREDSVIFLLELMISIVLENRDIMMQIWPQMKSHLHFLLSSFDHNPLISERAVVSLLRVASRNLFCPPDEIKVIEEILQSLVLLLQLKPPSSEELGVRAVQQVSKMFLYHLMTLSRLPSFPGIVKQLLLFMECYYRAGCADSLLAEAIPESLKNIVLVLDNSQLLDKQSDLHRLISRQLSQFLPNLVAELMMTDDISVDSGANAGLGLESKRNEAPEEPPTGKAIGPKITINSSTAIQTSIAPSATVQQPPASAKVASIAAKALSMDDLRCPQQTPLPQNYICPSSNYHNHYYQSDFVAHPQNNALAGQPQMHATSAAYPTSLPTSPITVSRDTPGLVGGVGIQAHQPQQSQHPRPFEIPELTAVIISPR